MYKVVLVDDEPWALLGIKSCYEWNKNGFDILCATTNPKEAYEVIMSKRPDLVLTDICMQDISGVDMMRMARNAGLDSEFIIVSGYSDFVYTKEAIRYGAFHYLLKPIDVEEVGQVMRSLLKHLANKKGAVENPETVNILFNFPENIGTIVDELTDCSLPSVHPYYQVVVAAGMTPNEANHLNFPGNIYHIRVFLGEGRYLFLLNTDRDIAEYAYGNWSDENRFVNTVFGISTLCKTAEELYEKFKEADIAANSKFMLYPDRISCYRKDDVLKDARSIKEIISGMNGEGPGQAEKVIYDIKKFLKERKPGVETLTLLYNQILSRIYAENIDAILSKGVGFSSYDQLVRKYRDVNDLIDSIRESLLEIKVMEPVKSKVSCDPMDRILEYVEANYDKPLYLSDISQNFFISTNYLCDLFKKKLGKTFTEYLTELRLKKADKLLKDTDYPILKIAEMSGYGDYCYFGKIFKKYYGVSPAVYRSKMKRG